MILSVEVMSHGFVFLVFAFVEFRVCKLKHFGFGKDSQLLLVMPLLQEQGNRFTLSHALRKFGCSSDATKSHMFLSVNMSLVELEYLEFKV